MKIRPIEGWRRVLNKAWSIRFGIISSVFAGVDVILPFYVESMPRGVFALLAMFSAVGGMIARLLEQSNLAERRRFVRDTDDKWKALND